MGSPFKTMPKLTSINLNDSCILKNLMSKPYRLKQTDKTTTSFNFNFNLISRTFKDKSPCCRGKKIFRISTNKTNEKSTNKSKRYDLPSL